MKEELLAVLKREMNDGSAIEYNGPRYKGIYKIFITELFCTE